MNKLAEKNNMLNTTKERIYILILVLMRKFSCAYVYSRHTTNTGTEKYISYLEKVI